jgi:hypothetical protein
MQNGEVAMSDEAPVYAALVTASLGLLGSLYSTITLHIGKRDQEAIQRATAEKLHGLKVQADAQHALLNAKLTQDRDDRLARLELEKVIAKIRDPLLHAAYDLQSRIWNILRQNFLAAYLQRGDPREQHYAVENTVFLLAQFLGWTELLRQEIQFLDVGDDEATRRIRTLQDQLYTLLQTDKWGKGFRLFAGEQRAVGELMIVTKGDAPRCLGYAAFLKSRDLSLDFWLDPIREDLKSMSLDIAPFRERLRAVQNALVDLLDFLDPNSKHFPAGSRDKL